MLTHTRAKPCLPRRVVVLGARGFISRHLQESCARGSVACLPVGSDVVDLTDTNNSRRLAQVLQADDAVVMTSMLTPERGRDYRALMSNLHMMETVCLALDQATCSHFVYLSSDAVYDAHQIPLDEDSSREPIDLYALSHTAREMMLSSELDKKNIPVCILRLTNIYGPGDTHNAYGPNRFVRSALREGHIELFGRAEERRSHVFIDDVIRLISLVLDYRSAGALNVAVRRASSFGDIAQAVIRLVGKPVHVDHLPRTVPTIHRPYKPTQVFRFIYNLGRPISPIVHRTFINTAVSAAFPEFCFTPLEDGLASFINAERNDTHTPASAVDSGEFTVAPRD
jgi:nucleoside-diphosphate-sugar epimerase